MPRVVARVPENPLNRSVVRDRFVQSSELVGDQLGDAGVVSPAVAAGILNDALVDAQGELFSGCHGIPPEYVVWRQKATYAWIRKSERARFGRGP